MIGVLEAEKGLFLLGLILADAVGAWGRRHLSIKLAFAISVDL